ncbi:MAG: PilC/PilY family type IV pilus protein, partial [Rhodanobacter sp.]|nr:PilC/PilY family type IV pilus protein [Rhodanobacter sp.]
GISTVAYAGDLHGQVWSFALNTGVTAYTATPTSAGVKLFTAEDANGNVQPITAGMLAGKDSATSNLWLFFGTGKYLSVADLPNVATQTWYGIIVQSGTSGLVSNLSTGRSALVKRAIVAETAGDITTTPPISPGRAITPAPSTPDMAGESGWYIDLLSPTGVGGADVQQGERIVTPNQFQGNQLIATTRIPKATDACNPTGAGWIMALNPFTGTAPVSNFFDINGDGSINSGDTITVGGKTYTSSGIGFTALPNNPIFVGSTMLVSFDSGATGSFATSGSGGSLQRVSWRELITQ